jgi:multidrug efflux pump
MSQFFVNRPVFAWVLSLVVMLVGGIEIALLPVAQYPSIAPPQISIAVTYPGASAQTVTDTVVRPILQQMSGLDGLEYISSKTQSNGSMEIALTFIQGTDPNIAQMQVQNKLSLAEASLPSDVTAQGINVTKSVKNFMLILTLTSSDGSMSAADISDYIASNLKDPLTRVSGVGECTLFGAEYAMRIWLDPNKLFQYSLTVGDVKSAITAQNIQVSSGELGGLPATEGQQLDATIIGPSRMESPDEFKEILLKVNQNGSQVRLRDVATVELGPQTYSNSTKYNGKPASALALKLAPGANQLATEAAVKAELARLQQAFPPGLAIGYAEDSEPYIRLSIEEVVKTLLEAIVLVFLVMFVFLQNFRATLIPTIAVPVVLLGTFGVMAFFGYTINTLTMLAMVLAVGLLVDDAIVVVENVERVMTEHKIGPREATLLSMKEISGALVGIAMVLSAVFLPMAFFSGSTGVIYRQFSVTIIAAMTLSVLVALILTPALCATLLKSHGQDQSQGKRGFGWFNRSYNWLNGRYAACVGRMLVRPGWSMLLFAGISILTGWLFFRMPTGFLPDEDQAHLFGQVSLPAGATAEQTDAVLREVVDYLLTQEKDTVDAVLSVQGFNFAGSAQGAGFLVIKLKDWDERPAAAQAASAVAQRTTRHFAGNRNARIVAFQPAAVMELGNTNGFDLILQDTGQLGRDKLMEARNQLLRMAAQDSRLLGVRPNGLEDAPQYKLSINREKARALGVSIADLNETLQGAFGSEYINQFTRNGRVKQVYIQGKPESRMLPSDIGSWYARNTSGNMVPFDAFVTGEWGQGPQKVEGYNGLTAIEILGGPNVGVSTGEAMSIMEHLVSQLPRGITSQWTGLSYEEEKAGRQTGPLYAVSFILILLCLAALYESWPIPFAVLLVVPLGVVGAIVATLGYGLDNGVYFQVGLLTTVGLAVKNAILIVEFAKAFFDAGVPLAEAALRAAKERLRPILMTSIAFVLGSLPLAIATGAGAGSRTAIGVAVVGGMLSSTFLAIFFVPVFFVVVLRLFRVRPRPARMQAAQEIALER